MSNKSVDINQALELMQKKEVLILDTRDAQSFATQSLPNAKNMTAYNAAQILSGYKKEQIILVYCYHGISSLSWVKRLTHEGFGNVYNLEGGFNAWQLANAASSL